MNRKIIFQKLIINPFKKREIPFLIFSSFLITFIVLRLAVRLRPDIFLTIKGVHIHHFSYGIFILAFVGFFLLIRTPERRLLRIITVIYGIGLALAFDEFGMWLRLEDDYWMRKSYDAAVIIILFLLNIVYFGDFWKTMGRYITKSVRKIFLTIFKYARAS